MRRLPATLTVVAAACSSGPPVPSPDGSLLYVAAASGVDRVATGSEVGSVPASGEAILQIAGG